MTASLSSTDNVSPSAVYTTKGEPEPESGAMVVLGSPTPPDPRETLVPWTVMVVAGAF